MDLLTRFSLRNVAAVLILVGLVTVAGAWSVMQLEQESMPDVSIPIVAVTTVYPGASPADVLDDVTKPLEDSLQGIPGIEHVNSESGESVSMVIAEFGFNADMEEAKTKVAEALGKVKLPDEAQTPDVRRVSFGSMPVVKLSVANDKVPSDQLDRVIRDEVIPKLSGVDGVGQVDVSSDSAKGVYIRLRPRGLTAYGLTPDGVTQQLKAANLEFPVGSVEMGDMSKPVRVSGQIRSIEALRELRLVRTPNQAQGLKDAFGQIGDGMGQLANGMGQMGEALGGLGSAVGQLGKGLQGVSAGLNGEIALLNGITEVQGKIVDAKVQLSQVQAQLQNPQSSDAQKAKLRGAEAGLKAGIRQLEGVQAGLRAQLATIQKQMGAAAGSGSGGSRMPRAGSSTSLSKEPEKPSADSMEPKIETVRLADVAEVTVGSDSAATFSRTDGKPSVVLSIVKSQDANTVEVCEGALKVMKDLAASLPKGSEVKTIFDASEGVKSSVNGMVREGLLGALFAFIVILLFLRDLRSTLIAIVSIPLSVLIAFVFLKQAGVTLNVMTLGGLTVAIGRVVDDSIVVIENIYRRFSGTDVRTTDLIREATAEVSSAITSSTLTTVAVFLPLGFVEGMIGKIFMPFALTVGLALMASLLVAVTVVPLVARFLLINARFKPHAEGRGRSERGYRRVLTWSLDHKLAVFGLAAMMIVGAGALMQVVGTGFMPVTKERFITVKISYPEGTSAASVNEVAKKVERVVHADDQVKIYSTAVGASTSTGMGGGVRGQNTATIFAQLDSEADVDATMKSWRTKMEPLGKPDSISVTDGGNSVSGSSANVEINVMGEDLGKVKDAATLLTQKLGKVEGLGEVSSNVTSSKPEVSIVVDQKKASAQGLSAGQVAMTVRNLLSDQDVGSITVNKEKLDIKLALKLDPVNELEDLRAVKIATPLGKNVRLDSVARVTEVPGPVGISTLDGEQYAIVSADILAKDVGAVSRAANTVVASTKLPKGITTKAAGSAEQMNEMFGQLGIAMLVAIGVVYLVMVLAFGEATAPLAILFSLPLAVIGGIFGLFVVGQPLNMPAMIGALMLIGIVVTNAIVLVDRVQRNRREGMPVRESLLEAGAIRMRPILMTAVATICALVPLAVGMSEGALISQSLAAIVIGGLTTSTLLTLIVVPVAYEMLERLFGRLRPSQRVASDGTRAGGEPDPEVAA